MVAAMRSRASRISASSMGRTVSSVMGIARFPCDHSASREVVLPLGDERRAAANCPQPHPTDDRAAGVDDPPIGRKAALCGGAVRIHPRFSYDHENPPSPLPLLLNYI